MLYFQEIAHAFRSLRRTKAFAFVALIVLATGIAANIIVFSIINAALLHSLPYPNAERLVTLNWYASGNLISRDISAPAFFALNSQAHSFESLAAISNLTTGVNLSTGDKPQHIRAFRISIDFFRTLGVFPAVGRSFNADEERPGGAHAVVLSDALWQNKFAGDRAILGHEIRINGDIFNIVGIMPPHFRFYPEADLWLPLQISPATADPGNEYRVIARLRAGIAQQDGQRELDRSPAYRLMYPLQDNSGEVRLVVEGLQSSVTADIHQGLTLLFGAVLFVLLIMCTNLAVLLTVRAAGRTRQFAIRLAMGASRACLLRMFLIEGMIISLVGGTTGIVLAKEAIPFVLMLAPANLPLTNAVRIDGNVILFTAVMSVLTGVVFGIFPALKMSRSNLNELLRQITSNASSSLQHARLGKILVSVQAALTMVLLTGAGLFLRSFTELHGVPPGFDTPHLWVAQLSLASDRYKTTAATAQFVNRLCEQVRNQPGIEGAAAITGLPLERGLNLILHPGDAPQKKVYAEYRMVSPDYMRIMHIHMIGGRAFSSSDSAQATPVAIINQTLARQWWATDSPLNRYAAVNSTMNGMFADPARQVVGVVADVHESSLSAAPPPTIFVPVDQVPDSITAFANRTFLTSIVVRTINDASPLDSIHKALDSTGPDLPVASVRPLSEVVSVSLARYRFYTSLISGFGVFALLLTSVGLYGLLSYQIVLRMREIGIRMALGASRFEVVFMIVKQGVNLVLLGASIGLLVAPLEIKALARMLYNVRNATSLVFVSAIIVLTGVAAVTGLLSAVHAASIEPAVTLTTE
ncbi:MAG TPA: ABC transporter permease [Candidatus Polarisedimenticolia bacterium]|nr:ABC transporter permease [Candidatus Polarisedimenticolia bacterium]